MTRPIYEPTTQRSVRRLGFSADQLFRRPSPAQEDAGGGQWCRVWLENPQTVNDGSRDFVEYDAVNNPYPTYYSTTNPLGGVGTSAIEILQDGVYAFTYRLYAFDLPDAPFATEMNGIDFTSWSYYERTWNPEALSGNSMNDTYVFRSGPTYGDTPPRCYVVVNVPAASTTPLVIEGDTDEATESYMEIIRISSADCVGNPSDPCSS